MSLNPDPENCYSEASQMTANAPTQSPRTNTWSTVPAIFPSPFWPLGMWRPQASRAYLTLTLAYGNLDLHLTPFPSLELHLFLPPWDTQVVSWIETSPWGSICFLWRGQLWVVIRTELDPSQHEERSVGRYRADTRSHGANERLQSTVVLNVR